MRKAALRKLFSQSRFNAVDGLDDYAEDYTRFEPLGNVVTHEMRRMLERARKAMEEGMIGLRQSGLQKIRDGITTIDEVVRESVL